MTKRKKKKSKSDYLTSDKVDSRAKKITGDREGYYIIIKWSIQQETQQS